MSYCFLCIQFNIFVRNLVTWYAASDGAGYERAISSYLLTCRILSFVCPSLYTAVVYFVVYLTFCLHFVVRVSAAPDPKAPTSEARVSGFPAEGDRASTSQESQDETRSSRRPITATPRATSPVRSSFNARRHNGGGLVGAPRNSPYS